MGIHINGDNNIVGDNNTVIHGDVYGRDYEPPPPPVGVLGLIVFAMILIWLLIKFWWVVLIVAGVAAVAFGTWLEWDEKRRGEIEKQRREQALGALAERQNSAYLQGDPWGMYGNFPPPPETRL